MARFELIRIWSYNTFKPNPAGLLTPSSYTKGEISGRLHIRRYFRVAKAHCDLVNDDSQNAFVSIIFAAMYIESVVNEVIFTDRLTAKMYEDAIGKRMEAIELDIYNERESFEGKVRLILRRFGVSDFEKDMSCVT